MAARSRISAGNRIGYIFAITINVLLIVFFANISRFNFSFLTPEYTRTLWAIYLSLGVSILANIFYVVNPSVRLYHLGQVFVLIFSIISAWTIYRVYPFSFAEAFWSTVTTWALIGVMICMGIALLVEFVRFVTGSNKR